MSKNSILNGNHDPKTFSHESNICECIYNLAAKLSSSDQPLTENHKLLTETETKNLVDKLISVSKLYIHYLHMENVLVEYISTCKEVHINQALDELGTILANSLWWERYNEVASLMGTDCVISRKTAMQVFITDKNNVIIKSLYKLITSQEKEVLCTQT